MFIVSNRNIFFLASAVLFTAAILALGVFGLKMSIEFTGGTLVEVSYESIRTSPEIISESLDAAGLTGYSLRESGELGYTLRTGSLSDEQRTFLASMFTVGDNEAKIDQLSEIGPTIGVELRNKAFVALGLVLVCILLFIAFAFRKVSVPISSWLYGFIALVTLVFDVVVPLGFFALLGVVSGAQVDTLFVTAMLTILGYSVHDTIVVFDRVRENLRINAERGRREDFAATAGRALGQTITRSINTSMTTLISLAALYLLGPESTRVFALTLLVGIVAGTYSSIFLATPLLVAVERWRAKR